MQTLYQSDGAFNAKIGSSQAERGRGRVALRILLAEPDPYLSFLIHLEFPEAEVLESESDPDLAGQAELVIVDLDAPGALDVLDADYEGKLLGIGDGRRARDTALLHGLDGLLLRPFLPEELYRAIRQALNFPEVAIEASRRAWRGSTYGLPGAGSLRWHWPVSWSSLGTPPGPGS